MVNFIVSIHLSEKFWNLKLRASRRVAGPARQPDSVPCDKHAGDFNFFLTTSFRGNFCLLTISILTICFPLPHLDNIVIDELADSLCRRRGVPLRDSQGERSLWFWIRFECWAVDQQTSDQKSFPLLLYFGKRNPWVRWSFKGVAPTLLSMTCKSITSHFTGQQKQGSPSWGEKTDEIITFTFTLWGNKNRVLQGAGKYGMNWSLSLLLNW